VSPAINDPHTAVEIVLRHGTVLRRLIEIRLPPRVREAGGVRVLRPHDLRFDDYIDHAFSDLRRAAADAPTVAAAIIATCHMLSEAAVSEGRGELGPAIGRHIDLVLATCEQAGLIEPDIQQLRRAAHTANETTAKPPA
jgi:uncharacterized membrane protein